jgi:2',3'-cyclic-nucleotide 2'-phosphodiesterase (5'-nucleotidase family)
MEVVIIHTNDSHGRFAPRPGTKGSAVTDRLRAIMEAHPGAVLLDAGDAVSAGNLGFRPGGEPALEAMSGLGYEAMCLGNRESHPRKEIFPLKLDRARFPILSANMRAKGDAPLPVLRHVVLQREGVRIGVFGVTVPMFTRKQWSQPLCDYWFDDPLKAAREQAAALRPQVDLLVALTHLGFRADQSLAAACPEVDLVIGGHSHTNLEAPVWVGETPVLQAWAFGYCAGIARARVECGRGRLVAWEKRPLRDDIPPG